MVKLKSRNAISRISVVDQVSEAIKQKVLDEVWKPGDKIPSESELADYFSVNRLSVRMALQKLSTLGLIETRVGEGSFVTDFSLQPYFSEIAALYSDKEKLRDVEQLRNLLEGECMQLAIINATKEELDALEEKLNIYFGATDIYDQDIDNKEYLENLVEADLAFHFEIIKMSHNHLYVAIYQMVQQIIRDHIRQLLYKRSHRRREEGLSVRMQEDTHLRMYNSIINGDVEEAKKSREQTLGIVPIHGTDYFEDFPDRA